MLYCGAMVLTAEEIRQVVAEIAPALEGGWVQKVYQPHDEAITFEVRSQGKTLTLYISADPETARLHFLSKKYPNPQTPPPFCQLLRARLAGARIEHMRQINDDRIVRIDMTHEGQPVTVVAELTGRTANIMLLDHDGAVRGQLRKGRFKTGEPYIAPVARARPVGAQFIAPKTDVMNHAPPSESPSLSAELERLFQERDEARARARQREAIKSALRKKLKRAGKRVEALESDLTKAERYRTYDRYGELLKSRLGDIPKGAASITVTDYFDPALLELVLPLDQAKSPKGNMEDYFKKYRKFLGAEKEIRPRLLTAQAEAAALRESLSALDRDGAPVTLSITETPRRNRQAPASRKDKATAKPFRRFTTEAGDAILVGRNSRENEELTFGLARSHDLWLHASSAPGSHVVLRLEKGAEARRESLLDAATLALQYSDLRKSGQGEVLYTYRKHVRKPRGAKPGLVTVTQDKRLYIKLDLKRLQRLKESLR
ncbi:MAG: NFACT family protein [Nitrospirae bacterium]|nr:NFACT family protein [Nitrospirota bacterium]